jgi:hypothetical protein
VITADVLEAYAREIERAAAALTGR